MTDSSPTATPDQSLIAQGDACAAGGNWSNAVAFWKQASEAHPNDVRQRLLWLLSQAEREPDRPRRSKAKVVLAASVCASLALVLMVIPDDPGSTRSNILAVWSWVFIVTSVILAVSAAHQPASGNLDALLARARRIAYSLDHPPPEEASHR